MAVLDALRDMRNVYGAPGFLAAEHALDPGGSVTRLTTSAGVHDLAGGHRLPVPSLGGVAEVAERDRVFEALFHAPASRPQLGRYTVLGTLGRGGMGTVLEAFDPVLDRRVAIKVLRRALDERPRARLMREARALARLSHPNVVQVYEAGEADGRAFVAMELVQGRSLREWLQRRPSPGWRECVGAYLQAGEGLAAAHAAGLVHRDFKPDNAVIDGKGRVRVLDFGLVRQSEGLRYGEQARALAGLDPSPRSASLTRTGVVLGTLAYMPLEQMQGERADARSDQFSFCVALYEALYGVRPFEGRSVYALMLAFRRGKLPPPPRRTRVPEALRKLLLRGLAIDPRQRWPSMGALLDELRASSSVASRRRVWWQFGLAVVVAVVITVAAAFAALAVVRSDEGAEPSRHASAAAAGIVVKEASTDRPR